LVSAGNGASLKRNVLFVVFFTFCFGFNDNNDLGQSTLVNNLGQQPWSTTLVNNLGQQPWSTTLVNNLGQQPWSTRITFNKHTFSKTFRADEAFVSKGVFWFLVRHHNLTNKTLAWVRIGHLSVVRLVSVGVGMLRIKFCPHSISRGFCLSVSQEHHPGCRGGGMGEG